MYGIDNKDIIKILNNMVFLLYLLKCLIYNRCVKCGFFSNVIWVLIILWMVIREDRVVGMGSVSLRIRRESILFIEVSWVVFRSLE